MIREANLKDIEQISKIIIKTWQSAFNGIIDPDYPGTLKEEKLINIMQNNINNKLENIFVYEDNNIIKGFISGKKNDNDYDCEIIGLYVLPEYQGNHIGKNLLERIKEFYKKNNCENMIIWTLLNAKNNKFYEKQSGIIKENKELIIGNKKYVGVGFVFKLLEI